MHASALLSFSETAEVCLAERVRFKRSKCGSTPRISEVSREYGIDHNPRRCSARWENGQRKGTEKPNGKHPTLAARASRRRGAGLGGGMGFPHVETGGQGFRESSSKT